MKIFGFQLVHTKALFRSLAFVVTTVETKAISVIHFQHFEANESNIFVYNSLNPKSFEYVGHTQNILDLLKNIFGNRSFKFLVSYQFKHTSL